MCVLCVRARVCVCMIIIIFKGMLGSRPHAACIEPKSHRTKQNETIITIIIIQAAYARRCMYLALHSIKPNNTPDEC